MKVVPLRLQPGNDLRRAMETWMALQQEQLQEQAGCAAAPQRIRWPNDVRLLERHLSKINASTSGFPGISYQTLIRVKAIVPTPIRCLLELNQFVLPQHGRHRRIAAGP